MRMRQCLTGRIRAGDEAFLRKFYEQYRNMFTGWMIRNHRCQEEEARELYQKAFSILYFNVKDGKITTLSSSLETYLFGIGKNLFRKSLRSKTLMFASLDEIQKTANDVIDYYEITEVKIRLQHILSQSAHPYHSQATALNECIE